VKFLNKLG